MSRWTIVYDRDDPSPIKRLEGKTFHSVHKDTLSHNDAIIFKGTGHRYALSHEQDCCEHVWLEDIVGDLSDLENTPILLAEERVQDGTRKDEYDYNEGCTWTFYELRSIKGSVTLRFCGTSNGYYSERVDFYEWRD